MSDDLEQTQITTDKHSGATLSSVVDLRGGVAGARPPPIPFNFEI